jgi:diaminopimelate decarboxylase
MTVEIGPSLTQHAVTRHAPHPWFETRNDELLIAGEPLSAIARRAGRTPFYAYDHTVIDRKLALLRQALPQGMHLRYAVKANPMPAVVEYLRTRTDGLDVASAGELNIALAAGASPQTISFAGPGKTRDELAAAIAADVLINVESERELRVLSELAQQSKRTPRIAIRVNPNFELKTSGMKMSGGPKPFGIDAERVPVVLQSLRTMPLQFVGLHIFSGSQNLQAASIIEAQRAALQLAMELAAHAPSPLLEVNLGGGLGIPYFPGEQALDLQPIAIHLQTRTTEARQALPQTRLTLELGRYIVGEAGLYVCQVIDRKISRGQVFLITDGGLHHHLAASGNFGQVIRKNYPVLVGNRVIGSQREVATVVGPLCTPLDMLADRMEMARAEEGDLIAVLQSGAYGLSASPTRFLGHPEPVELFV